MSIVCGGWLLVVGVPAWHGCHTTQAGPSAATPHSLAMCSQVVSSVGSLTYRGQRRTFTKDGLPGGVTMEMLTVSALAPVWGPRVLHRNVLLSRVTWMACGLREKEEKGPVLS